MANSSNKNFPHAYGNGRVIASFSLSHPGGPGFISVPTPSEPYLLPPAINGDTVQADLPEVPAVNTTWKPYDPADPPGGLGELTFVYGPDQQPYNATSFGVFVTGSGTKPLPYQRALAPYVPASVSPLLNSILPGTGPADNVVRPFRVVEDAELGSTHGQFVVLTEVEGDEVVPAPDGEAYYEVALNWKVPPIRTTVTGFNPANAVTNTSWVAKQAASVRDSLASTLWVTATLGDNALTTAHPAVPDPGVGIGGPDGATMESLNCYLTTNPLPPGDPDDPTGKGGWEAPYGDSWAWNGYPYTGANLVGPAEAPDSGFMEADRQPTIHASIHLKIISGRQVLKDISEDLSVTGPDFSSDVELQVVPVVRIYALYDRLIGEGGIRTVPRPLQRRFMRPCDDDEDAQPPCINVQVFQKNSSAPDGTIKPAYDLFRDWIELGKSE